MMTLPKVIDFIDYNLNVGPLQAVYCGFPGSGKSNHATSIVTRCLEDRPDYKGEMVLMHGDIACEWRHYLLHSQYVTKIILVFPRQVMEPDNLIQEFNINYADYKVPVERTIIDLEKEDWNIVTKEYMQPNCITVLYDDCFHDIDRTILWANIARQLAYRTVYLNNTITYLCHEAHEIFPQTAAGEQWQAIQDFISAFSLWRKRKIRAILISHQESEIYERVRKKCYWKFFRDSFPSNSYMRQVVFKHILKTKISTYHMFKGVKYRARNDSSKLKEINENWLMIPRVLISLNGGPSKPPDDEEKKVVLKMICPHCEKIWIPRNDFVTRCPRCTKYLTKSKEAISVGASS